MGAWDSLRTRIVLAVGALLVAALVAPSGSLAADWEAVYETDFSADPGWVTNDPARFRWDEANGAFYSFQYDWSEQYAYMLLPSLEEGFKWRMEFDILPSAYYNAGNARLCLIDSSLNMETGQCVFVDFEDGWPSVGQITLLWKNAAGRGYGHFALFQCGSWYRVVVEVDPAAKTFEMWVTRRADGSAVAHALVENVVQPMGIDRVALTTVGDHGNPAYWGKAYFDNLVISQRATNQPPAVDANGPYAVNEGGSVQLSATGSDPDGDPLTYAWDLDNNGTFETPGQTVTFSAADLDGPGERTVVARATDPSGLFDDDQGTIQVKNVAPAVSAGPDATIAEGGTFVSSGGFTDPGADSWTATVDYGDGSGSHALSLDVKAFALSHVYADNGTYTVTVRVADDDGGVGSDTVEVAVSNADPVVGQITAPVDPVTVGAQANVSAPFTDAGTADTHTAEWDWGDGSTSAGTVQETNGSGTAAGSHGYSTPGVYTVMLTVTDDDSGSGQSVFRYVVIYDPAGGFVTGGGWITSPAGAYTPDTSLTGKATFGFVAKYKKGAKVPEGQTEFQFHAGNLDFHSTAYQWLVVAGSKAKFKGDGTINGAGEYGFMLSANDDNPDTFRIKIWDKSSGDGVAYDNKKGESDDSDAGTEISGGNIVVHKGD